MIEKKSWGSIEILSDSIHEKEYQIILNPYENTNYHLHEECDEDHKIIQGKCLFILDEKILSCIEGEEMHISKKTKHCIFNNSDSPLILIEKKTGNFYTGDTSWYNDEIVNLIEKIKNAEVL